MEHGLTEAEYDECSQAPELMARIKQDVDDGIKRGIAGTPTVFVNKTKKIYSPVTKALIVAEIEKALK
jgi:protein-disulfide isomerase